MSNGNYYETDEGREEYRLKHQRDEDDMYDEYRDNCCNLLQLEFEQFCIDYSKKIGYYKDNIEKIKQHINVMTR